MAMNFARTRDGIDSVPFQPMERLKLYLFGVTVLFASFGMGEAVYRLLFSEFDGATDRIPVEVLFGLVFAWLATKFVGGIYRNRSERSARLNFIWARNHQIRGALEGITPLAHPSKNQQSIRVIREEVDRIERRLRRSCRAKALHTLQQRTVIMKFVTWDRRIATSASLALLCSVLLFVTCTFQAASLAAQSSSDQTDSPGAQEKQARKLATQTKTITGCLQKGYEPNEFSITGEDGKVWGLRSSAVKLDRHLRQKVTVTGLITHESKAGETKNGNTVRAPGNEESGDLRVGSLEMVSETCGK